MDLFRHGVRSDLVAKLRPLEGRAVPTTEIGQALRSALGDADRTELWKALAEENLRPKRTTGDPFAFLAHGDLGQYLVLIPEARLVAVRMIDAYPGVAPEAVTMPSFVNLVRALPKP